MSFNTNKKSDKSKKVEVLDSWDDEDIESDEDLPATRKTEDLPDETEKKDKVERDTVTTSSKAGVDDLTDLLSSHSPFYGSSTNGSRGQQSTSDKRPEKTMTTANRMIGAALGVRIRQTDEQRKAHKALIESEKKKRAEERERKANEEKAKRSVWEDN